MTGTALPSCGVRPVLAEVLAAGCDERVSLDVEEDAGHAARLKAADADLVVGCLAARVAVEAVSALQAAMGCLAVATLPAVWAEVRDLTGVDGFWRNSWDATCPEFWI